MAPRNLRQGLGALRAREPLEMAALMAWPERVEGDAVACGERRGVRLRKSASDGGRKTWSGREARLLSVVVVVAGVDAVVDVVVVAVNVVLRRGRRGCRGCELVISPRTRQDSMDCLGVVAFWHAKRWCWHHLLPTQAHMCAENCHGTKVEQAPSKRFEDLELHSVNVSHWNWLVIPVFDPEKVQADLQNCCDIDQVWRWADLRGSGSTEAELVQVNHHEGQKSHV